MEIEQYKYEIFKFLASNQGKTDVQTLMAEFTKGLENDELVKARNNIAFTIIGMADNIPKYIRTNFSPHSDLFKFLDEQAWRQERQDEFGMHDADKKITITEDGMINFKSLKELYDPSPPIIPQQNTYITTHGHNSPAAGHDLTLRDIKSRDTEQPINTETKKSNWFIGTWELISNNKLIAGILAGVIVAFLIWYFKLR